MLNTKYSILHFLQIISTGLVIFGIVVSVADTSAWSAQPLPTSRAAEIDTQLALPWLGKDTQPFSANRITFQTMNHTQPDISSDGSKIVYLGEAEGQQDVFLFDAKSAGVTNLSNTPNAQEDTPVFSPDGSTIAFASNRSGDWEIYRMDADGGNLRAALQSPASNEQHPAFFPDGQRLLFSTDLNSAVTPSNWDIYASSISLAITSPITSTSWTQLISDSTVERFPALANDAATIAYRRELTSSVAQTSTLVINSEIYVRDGFTTSAQRITNNPAYEGYPALAPDGSGVVFMSDRSGIFRLYSANIAGAGMHEIPLPPGWQMQHPRITANGSTLVFAAHDNNMSTTYDQIYSRPYQSPLMQVGERGFSGLAGNCDWEAGVLALGWIRAGQQTAQPQYFTWLRQWVDGCLASNPQPDHVNDGLLGYAALTVYEQTGDQHYLQAAEKVARYLHTDARRTRDGTLTHVDATVWDDTLLGVVPFFLAYARRTNNPSYGEDAVAQILKHAQHLQDPQSALYHHAWDEATNSHIGPIYWCRGNSWILLAEADALKQLPADHLQRPAILALFQGQAAALLRLQGASGLWHTVLKRPDFYQESACSALIGYAMSEGIAAGWLDAATFGSGAQSARFGMWQRVEADGTVTGVSASTGPMPTEADYAAIDNTQFQLFGQGAQLLLGSATRPK